MGLFRVCVLAFFALESVHVAFASVAVVGPLEAREFAEHSDIMDPDVVMRRLALIGENWSNRISKFSKSLRSLAATLAQTHSRTLEDSKPGLIEQVGRSMDRFVTKNDNSVEDIGDVVMQHKSESNTSGAWSEFIDSLIAFPLRALFIELVTRYVEVEICHRASSNSLFYSTTHNTLFPFENEFFNRMRNDMTQLIDAKAKPRMWVHAVNTFGEAVSAEDLAVAKQEEEAEAALKVKITEAEEAAAAAAAAEAAAAAAAAAQSGVALIEMDSGLGGPTLDESRIHFSVSPKSWNDRTSTKHLKFCSSKWYSLVMRIGFPMITSLYAGIVIAQLVNAIGNTITSNFNWIFTYIFLIGGTVAFYFFFYVLLPEVLGIGKK